MTPKPLKATTTSHSLTDADERINPSWNCQKTRSRAGRRWRVRGEGQEEEQGVRGEAIMERRRSPRGRVCLLGYLSHGANTKPLSPDPDVTPPVMFEHTV